MLVYEEEVVRKIHIKMLTVVTFGVWEWGWGLVWEWVLASHFIYSIFEKKCSPEVGILFFNLGFFLFLFFSCAWDLKIEV